jgi:hypothetical protein
VTSFAPEGVNAPVCGTPVPAIETKLVPLADSAEPPPTAIAATAQSESANNHRNDVFLIASSNPLYRRRFGEETPPPGDGLSPRRLSPRHREVQPEPAVRERRPGPHPAKSETKRELLVLAG